MTPEGAELQRFVAQGLRSVDAVSVGLWERIAAILAPYGDRPLTATDRVRILRQVERELAFAYGVSRAEVRRGRLYRVLTGVMTETANAPALRMLRDLEDLVTMRRDRATWDSVRQSIRSGSSPADRTLRQIVTNVDLNGPVTKQRRLLQSRTLDPERRWVPRERWTTKTGYRLSDRLWNQHQETRDAIDRRLRRSIREGTSAVDLARDLERHLNPEWRPLRDEAGALVDRTQGPGVLTRAPYERTGPNFTGGVQRARYITTLADGGFGSFPARRLARTEITRIHGAATIETAKVTPGLLGVRWRLSASHPARDRCDSHASESSAGLPSGVYAVDEVPGYPDHPFCLCVLIREMKSRDEVLDEIVAMYGGDLEGVAA